MRSKLFCSCFWAKKGTPGAVLGTSTITCHHQRHVTPGQCKSEMHPAGPHDCKVPHTGSDVHAAQLNDSAREDCLCIPPTPWRIMSEQRLRMIGNTWMEG